MIATFAFVVTTIYQGQGQTSPPALSLPTPEIIVQVRDEAEKAYSRGDWKSSVVRYEKLVSYPNAKAIDYFRLGRSNVELGNYAPAIKPLDVALAAAYDPSGTELVLARAYAGMDLLETALNHLEESVKHGLDDPLLIKTSPEFEAIREHKRYLTAIELVEFPAVKEKNGRLLDFMVGFWNYMMPGGAQGGFSVIRKLDKGSEIQETWTSIDGTKSTTSYRLDKEAGVWTGTSTNSQGWRSERTVKKIADGVRIEGITNFPDGTSQFVREDWKQKPDSQMEQVISHSYDGGRTWEELVRGKFTIALETVPPS